MVAASEAVLVTHGLTPSKRHHKGSNDIHKLPHFFVKVSLSKVVAPGQNAMLSGFAGWTCTLMSLDKPFPPSSPALSWGLIHTSEQPCWNLSSSYFLCIVKISANLQQSLYFCQYKTCTANMFCGCMACRCARSTGSCLLEVSWSS